MNILVPNLGTTSFKYQLLDMPTGEVIARGRQERVHDYATAIRNMDTNDAVVDAVAFKAVHAGPKYRGTFFVDAGVIAALEEFLPAAPAHNSIYLTAIHAFREAMPSVKLIAAFETEFHRTMPEHATRYGVPASWADDDGVQRYGFHGASHQYISERAPAILGRPTKRLISCHLGGSASICAILDGKSIDTTMGFSPQSGLENATRHGDLDVFAVLFMMRRHNWTLDQVYKELTKTGGLAGLSGIAGGDVRDLEMSLANNAGARLALDVFVYQIRKTIGAYAAAMEGVDAIAFTGGIGENSATLREACCKGLHFLGVHLDAKRNISGVGDRIVSSETSPASVVTLATNEEWIVARRAYAKLAV